MIRFLRPIAWILRDYRWFRRYCGGRWVLGLFFSQFTSWQLAEDFAACLIHDKHVLKTEEWPVKL